MEELNSFQKDFMEALATIQDSCVQIALCQKNNDSLEDKFYDLTAQVIVEMMELIDGYKDTDFGRLKVICEKTSASLKENPYIELHDTVCDYLKGV